LELDGSKSRLVVTENDYDDLYADETPVGRQLHAVLLQVRLVCVGFGLKDPELMRMLKRVGRMTTPARPLFAFAHVDDEDERRELLERFNIVHEALRVETEVVRVGAEEPLRIGRAG